MSHYSRASTIPFNSLVPFVLVFMRPLEFDTINKALKDKHYRALFIGIYTLLGFASIFLGFVILRCIMRKRQAAVQAKKQPQNVDGGPYRRNTMPHLKTCTAQDLNDHYVDNSGFTVANPSEFAMVSISTSSPDSVHI